MIALSRIIFCLLLGSLCVICLPVSAQETNNSRFTVHVVQRGENLFRIALQYNMFAEQIAEANGITDSDTIVVGQRLIIPLRVSSSAERLTHVVSTNETLASIAAAYSMSAEELIALNNLASAEALYVGQELVIVAGELSAEIVSSPSEPVTLITSGGSSAPSPQYSFARPGDPVESFVHIVESGDTLFEIGIRYNLTVDTLVQNNNLTDASFLSIGQRLVIPGIQLPRLAVDLPDAVTAFTLEPQVFEEGRTGRIELLTNEAVHISGQFLGQELQVIEREDGKRHNILIGIPMFTEMAVYPLTLQIHDETDTAIPINALLQVIAGGYGHQTITIDDSELLAPAVEEQETSILTRLAQQVTPERSWNNSLSLPAAAPMNALFGTLRSYNGSPFNRYHSGVDFAGAPGTSVLAAADGKVMLADRLHIRGNTIMIDHGWGVYTLYAHLQEILVGLGDMVTSGQVIGTIGSTGRSTGPHLHWEVWLNGVNIDPLQWVQQSFP